MSNELDEIVKYSKDIPVLYIEDNKDARDATIFMLEVFFDTIYVAKDGIEALEEYKKNKDEIKLIITDINMPNMNGLELIEKINEIKPDDLSILILSAYDEVRYLMKTIEYGVDGYLLKPVEVVPFSNQLIKIVDKIKLKRENEEYLNILKQYQDITDKSSIVSKADPSGKITFVNDKLCEVSGYSREELIGKRHNIMKHPDNPFYIYEDLWNTIAVRKETWEGVIKNRKKDGSAYYVMSYIKPILSNKGEIKEYISIRHEITEIMNQKKQLQDAIESNKQSFLVLSKIEDYTTLEKYYDNKTVQKLEDEFSKVILEFMPEELEFKKVYHLDNGEYAFIKECTQELDEQRLKTLLNKFQENVSNAVLTIDNLEYDIGVVLSYNIASKEVLENAKYGLKEAIESKKNLICSKDYAQKEQVKAIKNLKVIQMVKDAINSQNIVTYFQPIINNKTKEVEKYESLVRLIDKNKEIVSPYVFIDLIKKGRYYPLVTNLVLENSFAALEDTNCEISINLSVLDIEKVETREKIFSLIEKYKNDASRIVFELLEDENAKDFNTIKDFITDVKKKGVKIAIDDFGSGYSNFERLIEFQPDILKIDASLIKNIESDMYSKTVVETIKSFAEKQGIQTVAEFVSSSKIYNIVKDIGIDYSQGYHFGKPEPLGKDKS